MEKRFIYETVLELSQSNDAVIAYKKVNAVICIENIASIIEVDIDVVDTEADFVKETLRCTIIMLNDGMTLTIPMSINKFINKYKDLINIVNYSESSNNLETHNLL